MGFQNKSNKYERFERGKNGVTLVNSYNVSIFNVSAANGKVTRQRHAGVGDEIYLFLHPRAILHLSSDGLVIRRSS